MKKAKHAFGQSSGIEAAKQANKINAFDILFLDGDTDPKIGWLDSEGNTVIVPNKTDLSGVEADISTLETELANKVNAEEVDTKINTAVTDSVASANAYTDKKIEAAVDEHLTKKYEVADVPEGTLVDYRDKEIRVLCPTDTDWQLQSSGEGADANSYYIGFRAYAPDEAVSFKEDLAETIADDTMYYFEGNDFAGVDENGRKYSIVWLPVAQYDGSTWTYYGAMSSIEKYIGWYYNVQWYNADGVMIASDCIRINLSNEDCHSSIEPYYVSGIDAKIDARIEEKLTEINTGYEIIEF